MTHTRFWVYCLTCMVVAWAAIELIELYVYVDIGRLQAVDSQAFNHLASDPDWRIFITGDSTAVGTGAIAARNSIAGRLHQRLPAATIINKAKNGARINDVLEQLSYETTRYDLIVLQVGANDIIQGTDLDTARESLSQTLDRAQALSDTVVLIVCGDIGKAQIFPPPLNWWYHIRSIRYLRSFAAIANQHNVLYVDILKYETEYKLHDTKYYSADLLHLSDEGYGVWYTLLVDTLTKQQWPGFATKP